MKPECGKNIYKYIEDPGIYDLIKPIGGALEKIQMLKSMGHRVIFATHSTEGHAGRKFRCLKEHGFIEQSKDYIEAKDKSLVRADLLIDDNYDNIKTFPGAGILFRQPWNRRFSHYFCAENWDEVMEIIQRYYR